jgi:hypothetical protein
MLPPEFYANTLRAAYPPEHVYRMALYRDLVNISVYTTDGEIEGRGYTAGGAQLANYRNEGGVLHFDRNVDWFDADISAHCAVVYDADTGFVLSIIDFGRRCGVINGLFTVTLNEVGVVQLGAFEA